MWVGICCMWWWLTACSQLVNVGSQQQIDTRVPFREKLPGCLGS